MSNKTMTLDLRDDIRAGHEPFSRIMSIVARFETGDALLLIVPFEPKPLVRTLGELGFRNDLQRTETGDWRVLFTRTEKTSTKTPSIPVVLSGHGRPEIRSSEIIELDARGLEPPQPLERILETLDTLTDKNELRAHTDRRPMHLYALLEQRGFTGESHEQTDGSFITHIRRN